ncbi:hypothetical protein JRO89_XS01G0046600 [Xanthoceras sorbifolium]|uniref:UBA domain-containing protein n=1 Tax=Xanthoceras sorbifolium TaxID=99658 RepID=A0ABQ8IIF7_9ROSI|nr:hypothetical protein JRO89_XS01G0046600 [Xanthoceras sorbifolium]
MDSQPETNVIEVDRKLLRELEAMGFPLSRAAKALHYSGNAGLEDAVNWIIDHENDADIDQIPLVAVNIEINSSEPECTTEEIKMKVKELRDRAHQKKEEKKSERESEKVERRRALGFLSENPAPVNPSTPTVQKKMNLLSVMSVTKAEHMRECLRSLKQNHKGDDARVKRAFQTLLIYVGNVIKNPNEEKFRKIRVGNPLFQDRVGSMKGGIEFLELCGFERTEGGNFLFLPRDKVDMAALNSADSLLRSALTNPFFGVLSH